MEPTRQFDDELDDFERALLGSARVDEPDARAVARAALALGVGTTALTFAATSAAASSAGAAGGSLGTISKLAALGVFKWLSLGIVAGAMTTAGVELVQTGRAPHAAEAPVLESAPPPPRARPGVAPVAPPPELSPVPEPPAPEPEERAGVARAETVPESKPAPWPAMKSDSSARPLAAPASQAAPAPAATQIPAASFGAVPAGAPVERAPMSSIAEEIASLERARRGLTMGNPRQAIQELDRYEGQARARALGTEAAVLRVEALLQAGQRAPAVALARRLLAEQPQGPHSARLRRVAELSP